MKKTSTKDLRQLSVAQLTVRLQEVQRELFSLRSAALLGREKNVRKVRAARLAYARLLTIVQEKQGSPS